MQLAFRAADGLTLSVFLLERDCEARRVGLFAAQALPGVLPNSWTLADSDGGRVYVAFSEKAVEAADFAAALRRVTGGCDPRTAPPLDAPGFVARGVVLRAGGQP